MDRLSRDQRSRLMAAVRTRDTAPEQIVRSLAHRLGYRFRVHYRDLPGTPDLVFPRLRAVIFVHGCFWHAHWCKHGRVESRTRAAFWSAKRIANKKRDRAAVRKLRRRGWRVAVLWECELSDQAGVTTKLEDFLRGTHIESHRRANEGSKLRDG